MGAIGIGPIPVDAFVRLDASSLLRRLGGHRGEPAPSSVPEARPKRATARYEEGVRRARADDPSRAPTRDLVRDPQLCLRQGEPAPCCWVAGIGSGGRHRTTFRKAVRRIHRAAPPSDGRRPAWCDPRDRARRSGRRPAGPTQCDRRGRRWRAGVSRRQGDPRHQVGERQAAPFTSITLRGTVRCGRGMAGSIATGIRTASTRVKNSTISARNGAFLVGEHPIAVALGGEARRPRQRSVIVVGQ